MLTSKSSPSHYFQDLMRSRLFYCLCWCVEFSKHVWLKWWIRGDRPGCHSIHAFRFHCDSNMKTQNDPKWMWRAGTLWREVAPPTAPNHVALSGQRITEERMDGLSGSRLEEGSLWAIYQPLWLLLTRFVLRPKTSGDPDRCALPSEDGKTRGGQQRRDGHPPPLRARLSAGRGIQRAPAWRGVPEAGDPQSLQGRQAAEDGDHRGDTWRGGEETPA